ncbi:hypothetical protein SDC9_153071 [bioreactor metagenome]|uniref:Uncharacterized protein n=1 Tax=bioreactor metagenome TaxID=1076179 RepID=A0A645EVE1_9ZZZZ
MPGFVVHFHFHQHIAREKLAFRDAFLTALHFDDFFDWHQNLPKGILHASTIDAIDQSALHRLLETRVSVHHIPALCHVHFQPRTRS